LSVVGGLSSRRELPPVRKKKCGKIHRPGGEKELAFLRRKKGPKKARSGSGKREDKRKRGSNEAKNAMAKRHRAGMGNRRLLKRLSS